MKKINLPVIGGLKNVVNGSAKYTNEISGTVSPMLCICIVKYGRRDAVAPYITKRVTFNMMRFGLIRIMSISLPAHPSSSSLASPSMVESSSLFFFSSTDFAIIRITHNHIFITKGCLFVGYILSTGARFSSKGCRCYDDYLHKGSSPSINLSCSVPTCSEPTGEPGRVPCSRATAVRSARGGRRSAHQFTNNSKLPSFKKCHGDWWGCWLNRLAIQRPCG